MRPTDETTTRGLVKEDLVKTINNDIIPNIGIADNFYTVIYDSINKHAELTIAEKAAMALTVSSLKKIFSNIGDILLDDNVLEEILNLDKLTK